MTPGAGEVDVAEVYDLGVERYDDFRALWLRLAGGGAEAAMVADLRAVLEPGAALLDAGCGTGAMTRQALRIEPDLALTLVDFSAEMLGRAADLPGAHVRASVLELPFDDDSFDVVVSAWVIETLLEPRRAVTEYLRVLKPGGRVLYSFCSLPEGWFSRAGSAWLRTAVRRGFAGDFLEAERIPWHDCGTSHLARFRGGLTTAVALGKCCSVAAPVLPETTRPPTPEAP